MIVSEIHRYGRPTLSEVDEGGRWSMLVSSKGCTVTQLTVAVISPTGQRTIIENGACGARPRGNFVVRISKDRGARRTATRTWATARASTGTRGIAYVGIHRVVERNRRHRFAQVERRTFHR